ncbi:MAG: cyclic-phosphate processing receiver domain-containing protein [Bacteroidota bacterium]
MHAQRRESLEDSVSGTVAEGWVRAYTAAEAIEHLKTGAVEELSLDHDLGVEELVGTGYTVLQWIEKEVYLNGFKPPRVMTVYSSNSPAAERMLQAIASIEKMTRG